MQNVSLQNKLFKMSVKFLLLVETRYKIAMLYFACFWRVT